MVREVYPGGAANTSYVELQTYDPIEDQYFLGGHAVKVYGPTGTLISSVDLADVAATPGSFNNRTVLIGDDSTASNFGVTPDFVDSSLNIQSGGGAACWLDGEPPDCVSWGNFSGTLPTATTGSPVSPAGVTSGKAIRRKITDGCPTLLEPIDDTDVSAADFAEVNPGPRNHSTTPTEAACSGLPATQIDSQPAARTSSTSAHFTFSSPNSPTGFRCKLDTSPETTCNSGIADYSGLAEGVHNLRVRAVNAVGSDPNGSTAVWTVDLTPPTVTIDTKPPNPTPGTTLNFTYHADEPGVTFSCSLVLSAAPDSFSSCPSTGVTYTNKPNGNYVFKVKGTDQAGNPGSVSASPIGTYAFTVDNTVADTDPPETTLDTKPSDPSTSASASFTYHSDEAGSTFMCKLDSGAFASCPPGGMSYSSLANGSHTFQVEAIDPSNNVDPTPAGYTWTVAVPTPPNPDQDGDGVPDNLDQCPTVPGPASNNGCPLTNPPPPSAPDTKLTGKPGASTKDRTPTFKFSSATSGATFQCKIDGAAFKACRSPYTAKTLSFGKHTFQVMAVAGGVSDPSPAKFSFTVKKPPKKKH